MTSTRVFKFGGASVRDAEHIQNVGTILKQFANQRLVIVISAMGKTTNALEAVANAYFHQTGEADQLLQSVKENHYQVIAQLFPEGHEVYSSINDTFVEIEWMLEEAPEDSYDYIYDQIVTVGELLSTQIVAAYLNQEGQKTAWLDARDVILTDDTFREGKIQWKETVARIQKHIPPLLDQNQFVLTQGFIGSNNENQNTSLGREGSDFTAAILSYGLDAEDMSIWKDVPGILTADPRLFENVTKIDRLSYKEAIEMTYYGAKVIHPKTIKPLQNKNIPMYVKSFIEPEGEGTLIQGDVEVTYPPVVVVEKNQALLHISTRDFSFVAEDHLSLLFKWFAEHRLKVNLMKNLAISFTICVPNLPERIDPLMEKLNKEFQATKEEGLELITIRHYRKEMIAEFTKDHIVLLQERLPQTVQLVLKPVPRLKRK